MSDKLRDGDVAIVGLGGSGSYVLDLVAKTPIATIHLYDADVFSQHNAFRAPGAASMDDLQAKPTKVEYLQAVYRRMRRRIVAHAVNVDATNVGDLAGMSFVFVCIDDGEARRTIVEGLEAQGVPFIDVGLGIQEVGGSTLSGVVRMSVSTPQTRAQARRHLPFSAGGANEDYNRNIQVADLNCLSAALAVIKWKQLRGFYVDIEEEDHLLFNVDDNYIVLEGGRHAS